MSLIQTVKVFALLFVFISCQCKTGKAIVTLTSTLDGRQTACPGEVVTYTCTVLCTSAAGWHIPPDIMEFNYFPSSPIGQRTVIGDFKLALTSSVVDPKTPALANITITVTVIGTVGHNGTVVQCRGDEPGERMNLVLNIASQPPSPPQNPGYYVQHYGPHNVTVTVQWGYPEFDGGVSVDNYTISGTNIMTITSQINETTLTLPYNARQTIEVAATNCIGTSGTAMLTYTEANCSGLTFPGNGSIDPYQNTTEGAEIFFRCNPGFVPAGRMRAVCGADGRWDPDPAGLVCMVSCGAPTFASGVTVEPFSSTSVGSEIFYLCQSGFQPEGRETFLCGEDGRWNPNPATLLCEANCGIPTPPENGTIVNYTSTVEGSALLYQCNPGFGPVGEMIAVCAANGNWSPNPADIMCSKIVDCSPAGASQNESSESYTNTTEGSEAFNSCNQDVIMCSCSSSNVITAVVSCAVSFIIAALVGAVVHYCIVRKKCDCQKFYSRTIARKQQQQQPAPVYDDIVSQSQNIELKENVAYGPVQQ